MKARVQTDIALLVLVIMLTGIFYVSPQLHSGDEVIDFVLEFLGFICILKGTFLRMVARGHKKANSKESHSLVTSGVYSVIRNPMYFGTFMIGLGFTLILWPWWAVPIFVIVFYLRFKRQVRREEKFLLDSFGDQFRQYCEKTPRIFPSFDTMLHFNPKKIFNLKETFSTKENWGLISWPLLALLLSCVQQWILYHVVDLYLMMFILVGAILTYVVGFTLSYWIRSR